MTDTNEVRRYADAIIALIKEASRPGHPERAARPVTGYFGE